MAKASKKGASAPASKSRNAAKGATQAAPEATPVTGADAVLAEEHAVKAPAPAKAKRPPAVVKNGVQRPRAGGLCAAVWEITENLMSHNDATGDADLPSIAEVKAAAAEQGLNPTNVSIEYYRCRQFHGVRGRQKKAEQPVASE